MADISKISPDDGSTILNIKDGNAVHWGDQSKGYVGKNLAVLAPKLIGYPAVTDVFPMTYYGLTIEKTSDNEGLRIHGTYDNTQSLWLSIISNSAIGYIDPNLIEGKKYIASTYYSVNPSTLTSNNSDLCQVMTGTIENPYYLGSITIDSTNNIANSAFTMDSHPFLGIRFGIRKNAFTTSAVDFTVKLMLRNSEITDIAYEPYLTPNTEIDNKVSYADNTILGAKNLLNYSNIGINPSNTDTGTITDNGKDGISVNVTKTSGHWTDIKYTCNIALKANVTYKFSCIGIPNDVKGIRLYSGSSFVFNMENGATSAKFKPSTDMVISSWFTTITTAGATTTTFTYYPMMYVADDTDNTYQQPNTYTNRELSDRVKQSIENMLTTFKSEVVITGSNITNVEWARKIRYGNIMIFQARINKATNTDIWAAFQCPLTFPETFLDNSQFTANSPYKGGTGTFDKGTKTLTFRYSSDEATYVDVQLIAIVSE